MKLSQEKIDVLRLLTGEPKTRHEIIVELKINWETAQKTLKYLHHSQWIFKWDECPAKWKITEKGKTELEKWDKDGVQKGLFEVGK